MKQLKGIITDIQRTSIHDGPGIRTTIFFKGCNMHCAWCHNPETVAFQPEMIYYPEKCVHCGGCKEGCVYGARVMCGKVCSTEEIIDIVEEDKAYYGSSGGMTVSGGEPAAQPEFLELLLKEAKRREINAGIETNMSMDIQVYERISSYIDYWMSDFKLYDEEKHKKYTGISNKKIIDNIMHLDKIANHNLIIRTPVIKGINDTKGELEKIVQTIYGLQNLMYYEMLPYHPLGLSKHVAGNRYIERFESPDKLHLKEMAEELKTAYGIAVKIAGVSF